MDRLAPEVTWTDNSRIYFEESTRYPAHSGTHVDTCTAGLKAEFPWPAEGTSSIVQKRLIADRTVTTEGGLASAYAGEQAGFPAINEGENSHFEKVFGAGWTDCKTMTVYRIL